MDHAEIPIRGTNAGDRLFFYVDRWRTTGEGAMFDPRPEGTPAGWCEVFCWTALHAGASPGFHWYTRSPMWIAFRMPGDDQSYDAHVTAWRIEPA